MDNSKKLLAIIVVALMALSPLAIAYGSVQSEGADTQDEIGSSVEIKDMTYKDIQDSLSKFGVELKDTYDFNGYKYSKYVITALFPGANPIAFGEQGGKNITVTVKNPTEMSVSIKADIYNSAVKGKELTQKVALSISVKNIDLEFSNLNIGTETPIFTQEDLTSLFVNGDYAKYVTESKLLKYKTADDTIRATGSLDLKVYLQTDLKAASIEGKNYITEGGIQVFSKIPFIPEYIPTIGPVSDVRVELSSDMTVDIINSESKRVYQTSEFKSDIKALFKADIEYVYDADYKTVSLKVKDLKASASESATIDGKSNNKLDVDLTSNAKAFIDGRSGPVYDDMCVFDGKIEANKLFDIRNIPSPIQPTDDTSSFSMEDLIYFFAKDKAAFEYDAAKVNTDANAIASEINGDVPAKDNTAMIIALVAIALALVIIIALFYRQKKAKI